MKQWILKLLGELGEYLAVLFKSGIQQELKLVMPIAMNAVKAVAADSSLASSSDKFDKAFSLIGDELGKGQQQIGTSLVNLAIELAYQKFLDQQSPSE